jgi:hypothetical protein
MAARDGQTLGGQSLETQNAFRAAYGSGAESAWESEHNAAIGGGGGGGTWATNATPTEVGGGTGANIQGAQMALQAAQNAANQAYLNAKLNLDSEDLAFRKATQAFQNSLNESAVTGIYKGQPTLPAMQSYANLFGTWAVPTAGQETLASRLQTANLLGTYSGQQTLQAQRQQGELTGYIMGQGGAPTPQAIQNFFNTSPLGAWAREYARQNPQLLDPATQRQLLATRGWIFDPSENLGAPTMQMQQQQFGQALASIQEARAAQAQQQQQAQAYLNLLAQLRGPADWAKYQQVLGATPQGMRDLTAAAMGQYIPGGGATTGQQPTAASLQSLQQQVAGGTPATAQLGQLPAPNQLAPQAWKALAPSQQQLLVGAYEAQGWNPDDVRALFAQSLPRYASNAPQGGTWRLAA